MPGGSSLRTPPALRLARPGTTERPPMFIGPGGGLAPAWPTISRPSGEFGSAGG